MDMLLHDEHTLNMYECLRRLHRGDNISNIPHCNSHVVVWQCPH